MVAFRRFTIAKFLWRHVKISSQWQQGSARVLFDRHHYIADPYNLHFGKESGTYFLYKPSYSQLFVTNIVLPMSCEPITTLLKVPCRRFGVYKVDAHVTTDKETVVIDQPLRGERVLLTDIGRFRILNGALDRPFCKILLKFAIRCQNEEKQIKNRAKRKKGIKIMAVKTVKWLLKLI